MDSADRQQSGAHDAVQKERPNNKPFKYSGISSQGGRSHNEDSFASPDSFFLPYTRGFSSSEVDLNNDQLKEQAQEIADKINGLKIINSDGSFEILNFTGEYILNIKTRLNGVIKSGKLKSLAIVADGAGGHGNGDLASTFATLITTDELIKAAEKDPKSVDAGSLKSAIIKSDKIIDASNRKNGTKMATTIVVAFTNSENKTYVSGIADSRIYKRDKKTGKVVQLTEDDSLAWRLLERENLPPSAVYTFPQRNVITNALQRGDLNEGQLHVLELELSENDQLILCTDGAWEAIDPNNQEVIPVLMQIDKEFKQLLIEKGVSEAAKYAFGAIMEKLNLKGLMNGADGKTIAKHLTRSEVEKLAQDNITALIVEASNLN